MTQPSTLAALLTVSLLLATTVPAEETAKPRAMTVQELTAAGAGGSTIASDMIAPELAGVDMSLLDHDQKLRAFKLFHSEKCNCGCDMSLFTCRTEDQACGTSQPLAQGIVDKIAAGKTNAEIISVPLEPVAIRRVEEATHKFDLAGAPSKGPAKAKVTVVEFGDFQCELCALAHTWLPKVLELYPNDVRLVFKNFPLQNHRSAVMAAEASMAAHAQGKFWQLLDRMYADINGVSKSTILVWAKEVGIDVAAFTKSLDENKYAAIVMADASAARAAGATGTPTFFINGHKLMGVPSYETLRDAIEEALAK